MGSALSRKRKKKMKKSKKRPVIVPRAPLNIANYFRDDSSDDNQRSVQKRYDPGDRSFRFVDREDEMDFEYNDYDSLRAEMSCGHTVTPQSLTDWCFRQLDEGQCNFVCGNCDNQWPIQEVYKMALFTPKESEDFERKLFANAAENFLEVKHCPSCKSLVSRMDTNNVSVQCLTCTARKGRNYTFCWQCMKEWKGPAPRSDGCDNINCQGPLDILAKCPYINFNEVKGVHNCPSIRACPKCGMLLEHNKQYCRGLVCKRCKTKFCFVCLSATQACLGKPYEKCPNGVAPRQTTMPVWNQQK